MRDFEESPLHPTAYAGIIELALVPTMFRRFMDKRVEAHFQGDISRANLSPRKREKLLAAYPPPAVHEDVVREDMAVDVADEVLAARCPGCGYTYEVAAGNELEGFAAGTAWKDIPDDWCCPDCGVREKVDFVPLSPSEVA
jgi:alkane 1-monooxygenase